MLFSTILSLYVYNVLAGPDTDCIRETSFLPGCKYSQCEIDTCLFDSFCCAVQWDGICKFGSSRINFSCWCPGEEVGHVFRHPDNCFQYYQCDYNQQNFFILDCPEGTKFSNLRGYCEWEDYFPEEEYGECGINDKTDPLCKGDNSDGHPFPIEGNCLEYGVCGLDGQLNKYTCPSPLIFNPLFKYCDWSFNVLDSDSDGVFDHCDECPFSLSGDTDSDGICDNDDLCPNDPDNDIDNDGLCGDVDECPDDPTNSCNDPSCGDGNLDEGEFCDDGNLNNGDGCDSNCECESDFNLVFVNVNGGVTPYDDALEYVRKKYSCIIRGDIQDFPSSSAPPNWFWNPAWGVWPYPVVYGGVAIDDVVIGYSFEPIDGVGTILGSAGMRYWRTGGTDNLKPLSGFMTFDSADIANIAASGGLNGLFFHEVGHILGLVGTGSLNGFTPGCTPGGDNGIWAGPLANIAYTILGFSGTLSVETDGSAGTSCAHWNENTDGDGIGLQSEFMTGFLTGSNIISLISIQALADLGYSVDTNQAETFNPGNVGSRRRSTEQYDMNINCFHTCNQRCNDADCNDLCLEKICHKSGQLYDPFGNPYLFHNDVDDSHGMGIEI